MTNQQVDAFRREGLDAAELKSCLRAHLGVLRFAEHHDLPAGEVLGKAHVLAATADGLAVLVVRNDQLHLVGRFIDVHARHVGGLNGVHHVPGGIGVEGNDVDGLAAELGHDGLHA